MAPLLDQPAAGGVAILNPSTGSTDSLPTCRTVDRSGGRGPSASPGPRSTPRQQGLQGSHDGCGGCEQLVDIDAAAQIVTSIRDLGIRLRVLSTATGLSVSMLSEIAHRRRPTVQCATLARLRGADTELLVQAYPGTRHHRLREHLTGLRDAGISDRAIARRAGLDEATPRRAYAKLPTDAVYDALMSLDLGDFPDHVRLDATLAARRTALLAQFLTLTQISTATGIDTRTLSDLHHGRLDSVPLSVHTALFALPVPTAVSPTKPVTSWETHRRMRALLAAGWGTRRIAGHTGLTRDTVRSLLASPRTTAGTVRRALPAITILAAAPAPDDTFAARVRAHAHTLGAEPLYAWTTSTVDDPDATPLPPHRRGPHPHQLTPAPEHLEAADNAAARKPVDTRRGIKQAWIEDVEDLAGWGAAWPEVEARTGVSRDSIQRILLRHNRTDLTERITMHTTGVVA